MKRLRWPRPPLILGFVLGGLVERYMFISVERYDWEWLWIFREGKFTPWVSIIFAMTLYGVLRPILKGHMERAKSGGSNKYSIKFRRENLDPNMYFSFGVVATFATCIYLSWGWEFGARLVPHVIATPVSFLPAG